MYVTGRCLLGEILSSKGWSQRELSRRSKVPTSTLSDYILNKSVMSIVHAKNISAALDCAIEDLYEWVIITTGS